MSAANKPQPTKSQVQATHNGVSVELNSEALSNLAGMFDVLIQMDFDQKQRNEAKDKKDE